MRAAFFAAPGALLLLFGLPGLAPAGVTKLEDGPEGLAFRIDLPELVAAPAPDGRVILRAEGFALPTEAGLPAVPELRLLVALPPGASAAAEVEGTAIERTDAYRIAPVPRVDWAEETHYEINEAVSGRLFPDGWVEVSSPARLRDQTVATVSVHPVRHDFATGRTEILRSAVVRVRFVPGGKSGPAAAPAPPDAFEDVYEQSLLNYDTGKAWRSRGALPAKALAGDSFASSSNWYKMTISAKGLYSIAYDDLVDAGVLNPRTAIGDPRTLRVYTGTGLSLPEPITSPRLDWMNQVAIRVVGEEDGSFDTGDRIEFHALGASGWAGEYDPDAPSYWEEANHTYSWTNAYWLTWGGSFEEPVRRIAAIGAGAGDVPEGAVTARTFPDRVHWEDDSFYKDLSRFGEDGWFWDRFSPTEASKAFTVVGGAPMTTPDADTSQDGNVRIRFYHYADELNNCGTERARIQVNSVPSALQDWNSCTQVNGAIQPFDYDSTAHWVKDGTNRIEIQVIFRQKVYLCWIEMGYQRFFRARGGELRFRIEEPGIHRIPIAGFSPTETRVFDVTDPFDVKELGGIGAAGDSLLLHAVVGQPRSFYAAAGSAWKTPASIERVVPAGLRGETNGAEYVVIATDSFVSALSELVAHRSLEYTTRIYRLSDVYNEFSWGLSDAVAIRDFLAHAYHAWPEGSRPIFVLLVGDATSDWKGRQSSALSTLLPTYFHIDPGGSETNTYATDDFFTYLDPASGATDLAPDISIGRFPVNNAREARVVAEKTIQYETDPEFGRWRNRILFLADDEVRKDEYDCGFLLTHTSDAEKAAEAVPMSYDRVKVYMVEYPLTSSGLKPLAKDAYIDMMNEGYLFSNYLGHGGFDKMADEELFLLAEAAPGIVENGRRLHIFGAFSCSIGSFDLADRNSLAETLLKMEDGGAIASFSSDAPAFAGVSLDLDVSFLKALFPAPNRTVPLGLAAESAKAMPGLSQGRKINDEKYTILGDPALRVGIPEVGVRFEEGGEIRFERGGIDTLHGEVVDTNGVLQSSFDGTAYVTVKGMADTLGYSFLDSVCYGVPSNPRPNKVSYLLEGPTFFRGEVDVAGGRFEAPFFVPRDTRVGTIGRVSVYVYDPGSRIDGANGTDSVTVAAEDPGPVWDDEQGPDVSFTVNGIDVRDGTSFTKSSVFRLELEDRSGINLQRNDNYYTIHLVFDRGRPIDLTPLFEYETNSYQKGGFSFQLSDFSDVFLQAGSHELALRASDNLENRTEKEFQIFVAEEGEKLAFRAPVLNYPNPFDPDKDGETQIAVDLTRSARVTLQILTHTGKKIREVEIPTAETGMSVRFEWDGRDQDGDPVANGVYFVRAVAESEDGEERTESVGKAVVLRGAR